MQKHQLLKIALVIVSLILVCFGFSFWQLRTLQGAEFLFPYRAEWSQIHLGDSRADVEHKCPQKNQEHYYGKGDHYYDTHSYGFWGMLILYDAEGRVQSKLLKLRIGTKDYYHEFYYGPAT